LTDRMVGNLTISRHFSVKHAVYLFSGNSQLFLDLLCPAIIGRMH